MSGLKEGLEMGVGVTMATLKKPQFSDFHGLLVSLTSLVRMDDGFQIVRASGAQSVSLATPIPLSQLSLASLGP